MSRLRAGASASQASRLAAIGALALAALAFWLGGVAGVAYLALLALTMAPGLPIGWRLFGTHPAGWVSGALIGYILSTLAFWVAIRAGLPVPLPLTFGLAWALLAGATFGLVRRGRPPLVDLPAWTPRSAAAWAGIALVTATIFMVAVRNVGARDATGAEQYRAYFTADFFWHLTVANEVAHFDMPPRNPFLASEQIYYYWTYWIVPAVLRGPDAAPIVSMAVALKVNALAIGLLLASMMFLLAWRVSGRPWVAATATAVAVLAPSLEGLYTLVQYTRAGTPLDALRDVNIDAVTAWEFHGLRIDNVPRLLWYTPHHAASIALGLVALLASIGQAPATAAGTLLTGLALAGSVAINPFLGAMFCLIYGVAAVVDLVRRRIPWSALLLQGLAVAPVVAALAFCLMNGMNDPTGSPVTFGLSPDGRHAPVVTFLLSFGGLLPLVILGMWPWRGFDGRLAIPAIAALVLGIGLMYGLTLDDRSWIGFRAGNLILVTAPMLAARGLAGLAAAGRPALGTAIVVVCLLAGLPTTAIDAYNAQDVANRRQGPGFLWTITMTPAQQSGFDWLRQSTAPGAIVQVDPVVRGRQNWCVIPAFAGRRMSGGLPISLLDNPEYKSRSNEVRRLLLEMPPEEAHAAARRLAINYLWLDQDDGPSGRDAVLRLTGRPDLFSVVFRRAEVAILQVR